MQHFHLVHDAVLGVHGTRLNPLPGCIIAHRMNVEPFLQSDDALVTVQNRQYSRRVPTYRFDVAIKLDEVANRIVRAVDLVPGVTVLRDAFLVPDERTVRDVHIDRFITGLVIALQSGHEKAVVRVSSTEPAVAPVQDAFDGSG